MTLVKICGLNNATVLDAAIGAGADLVGFVHFARSPRYVDVAAMAGLVARAERRVKTVALVVDADDATLAAITGEAGPDLLQLHGKETVERVAEIRARFGRPVIKVFGVAGAADIAPARAYEAVADHIMFDAKPPKDATRPGGNGIAFDWTLLAGLDLAKPFVLSGGLDAGNVAEALRITRAPIVDVSSGVERQPGDKDPAKIEAFVRAVRAVEALPEGLRA